MAQRFGLALFLATIPMPNIAMEKGWFGVGLNVSTNGIWDPIVESVTLEVVASGSPAEDQKLMVGDVVIELNGIPVPGAKGEQLDRLKEWVDKTKLVGDTLTLKLSRAGKEPFTVVLIATPRPQK